MTAQPPTWRVELASTDIGLEEIAAASEVLASGWLSMGDVVRRFEERFAAFTGCPHAVAVTNGTAALHLGLLAAGIGPGDEVIVPSLTFVATANAVLYAGATPVFADICGPHDLNLSPEDVTSRITPRTRAILPVHYAGRICAMDALLDLARRHGLALVEDCAHAPGSGLPGPDGTLRPAGTFGAAGCFSFFPNKNLTTAEGGMVTCTDDAVARRLRSLRAHGMTTGTLDRHRGRAFSYDVTCLGYNYRMDEVRAAIGLAQVGKLAAANARRGELAAAYREKLTGIGWIEQPFAGHPGVSCHHIMPVLLARGVDRTAVAAHLKDQGIQSSVHYPPVHLFSYYRERLGTGEGLLPATEDAARRGLTLPLHSRMGLADVDAVVQALASFPAA